MSTLISSWARLYGLTDPIPLADQVHAAEPARARDAAARYRAATIALELSRRSMLTAARVLESAWSAPEPQRQLQTLMALHENLGADFRSAAQALDGLADTIVTTRQHITTALAAARATIVGRGLAPAAIGPEDVERISRERCLLVTGLHGTFRRLTDELDRVATACVAALAPDPRRHLPPGMTLPLSSAAESIDTANRARLDADLALTGTGRAAYAAEILRALTRVEDSGYRAQLLQYSADAHGNQGAAAISAGDIAAADTVSVIVPGIGNSPAAIGDSTDLAADLTWATETVSDRSHATVLWFGYDIPLSWPKDGAVAGGWQHAAASAVIDTFRATNATTAAAAAMELGRFTGRLRRMMTPSAGLTLIGHSYGSTVVSQAARAMDERAGVSDIVLLGSPGAGYGIDTAEDYRAVGPGHVYTVAFPDDPVTRPVTDALAALANPVQSALGARLGGAGRPFGVNPNASEFGGEPVRPVSNTAKAGPLGLNEHAVSNYLSGFGLTAVAEISAGQYGNVDVQRRPR